MIQLSIAKQGSRKLDQRRRLWSSLETRADVLDPLVESLTTVTFSVAFLQSQQHGYESLVAQTSRVDVEKRLVGERRHALENRLSSKVKHGNQFDATRSEPVFVLVQNSFHAINQIK